MWRGREVRTDRSFSHLKPPLLSTAQRRDKWLAMSGAVQLEDSNRAPRLPNKAGGSFCLDRADGHFLVACGCGFAEILPRFSLICIVKCLILLIGKWVRRNSKPVTHPIFHNCVS